MNPPAQILHTYPVMILDGAPATKPEWRGCDLNDPFWSAKILPEAPVDDKITSCYTLTRQQNRC